MFTDGFRLNISGLEADAAITAVRAEIRERGRRLQNTFHRIQKSAFDVDRVMVTRYP